MPPFDFHMVIFGVIGGALPDIIRVIKGKDEATLPDVLKRANFWVGFILLLALGGFTTWILQPHEVKQAIAIGFSAPEVISRLAAKEAPGDRGPSSPFSMKELIVDLRDRWTI